MSLINPPLEVVTVAYCSNLASNYGIIRFIRFVSRFTGKLCNVFFLFCLDLSLHSNTGKKIRTLNLGTKHGIKRIVDTLRASICTPTQATSGQIFKLLCESIISVFTPMIRCDSFSPLMANRWEQPKLGHHRRHRRRNQDLVHKGHDACIWNFF